MLDHKAYTMNGQSGVKGYKICTYMSPLLTDHVITCLQITCTLSILAFYAGRHAIFKDNSIYVHQSVVNVVKWIFKILLRIMD